MNNTTIVRLSKLAAGLVSGGATRLITGSNTALATGVTLGVIGCVQTDNVSDDLTTKELALECAKVSGLIGLATVSVAVIDQALVASELPEETEGKIDSEVVLSNWV